MFYIIVKSIEKEDQVDKTIYLEKIKHDYGDSFSLGVNKLTIYSRKIHALYGGNGAGKTTLLKYLSGEVGDCEKSQLFSYLPYLPKYLENSYVDYLINSFFEIKGVNIIDAEIYYCLGIKEISLKKASILSTGQMQRLLLFLSLHDKEKIILLDEPINGLEGKYVERFSKFLFESEKFTILISAHQHSFLNNVSSHFYKMNNGKIEKSFSKEEAKITSGKEYVLVFSKEIQGLDSYAEIEESKGQFIYKLNGKDSSNVELEDVFKVIKFNNDAFVSFDRNCCSHTERLRL